MPEPRRIRIHGPAELAGLVPHLWHYTPGEGQVAALALGPSSSPGLVTRSESAPGALEARALLDHAGEADRFVLIGYGTTGRRRASDFADALRDVSGGGANIAAVAAVDDGRVHALVNGRWDDAGHVRDMSEHFVLEGSDPAPSRDAHEARFQPLAEPAWASTMPADRNELGRLSPSERAERARGILDQLAIPGAHVSDADRTWLTSTAGGDGLMRDVVMQHGWDRDRAFALVGLYRGAPPEHRDVTAALAGAAMFAQGDMVAARTIVDHIDPRSQHASFGELVRISVDVGAPPDVLTAEWSRQDVDKLLGAADERWQARSAGSSPRDVLRHQAPASEVTSSGIAAGQPYRQGAAASYGPGSTYDPPSAER